MTNGYGPKQREGDFYEINRDEPVNLFSMGGLTQSGDIVDYDKSTGIVTLGNCIQKVYHSDGTSEFAESVYPLEVDTSVINFRTLTTREDRLGRIVQYNQDLEKGNGNNGKSKNEKKGESKD